MSRFFLTCLIFLVNTFLFAQSTGIVKGTILDENGLALASSEVYIDGTLFATFTDSDGFYQLEVDPGNYELIISSLGYEDAIEQISILPNQQIEVSIQLQPAEMTKLEGVSIVGQRSKELESTLLLDQMKSAVITESIGVKELERKGVSNVASAITKVSGISKQEGSSVIYVRGLGDRYNSTTMNGLPIPSNDPEYKNIDLSLFSTDILTYIGIDKVYSGLYYGDFAGGNIDIISKKQTGKGFFSLGMSSRVNSNAIRDTDFKLQQGINWLGFDKTSNPQSLNSYAFENSLNPKKSGALGSGLSLTTGDRFNIGLNGRLSFFLTANHENEYTSIKNGYLKSGVNAQGTIQGKDFEKYNVYQYNTNTNAFLNLFYQPNRKNNISFNSLLVNTSNQKLEEGEGYMRDNANEGGLLRRGTFVQNTLWVNQLLGEHQFNERSQLKWALGYNSIKSDMPDRFQNIIEWKSSLNHYIIANSSASLNHRYFQELTEDEYVGNISYELKFNQNQENNDFKGKVTVGYNGRMKSREFQAMQYNMAPRIGQVYVTFNDLDAFYNSFNFNAGYFSLSTFSGQNLQPQFYNGKQNIHSGFALFEYKLSPKLLAVIGLRGETIEQTVDWNTSLDPSGSSNKLDEFQFLPSLSLKYELTDRQNLRFAISKTYTLPQFKERALFMYEDLGETVYGWPTTYASTDYNVDLKWEIFPGIGEVLSATAFGKYIENPINKFTVASSTNDISYANTGDWGYVYGAEVELRKNLYRSGGANPIQLTFGANVSYAKTQQELNNEKVFEETLLSNGSRLNANFTNQKDRFQGASDLLLNGDISFIKEWEKGANLMMTLTYNYFSDRIYALGTDNRGNIVEKGVGTLDFIIRTKINSHLGLNLNARNLLNPSIERTQENNNSNTTVLHYKKGINLSLGVNLQF